MTASIQHRGPDDSGIWSDAAAGVMLGFRRLAIVDLSQQGHQPMRSVSGRFTIIFNGEIYNHPELRRELETTGCRFRGHSDTEVILAAFERWGIEPSVRRFIGMFAMAVWDAERRQLSLVRDRLGIKPMFVFQRAGLVTFGSELKALQAGPEFDRTLNTEALTAYLRFLYVPAPHSIFQHTIKLLPGHILTLSDPAAPLPTPVSYWSAEEIAGDAQSSQFSGDDAEGVAALESLLGDAVRLRMQADVPLGALLSGGIDSSTVVALMQTQSTRPIKTFTIGFDSKEYDEAAAARAIAAHLGTDHTELHVTGADALSVVPQLPTMFDEPLADPSQIPTYLVCRLARQHVTVALTGDGGDELFAGYNRYVQGEQLIDRMGSWPASLRRASALGLTAISPAGWDSLRNAFGSVVPAARTRLFGEKVHKIGDLLRADDAPRMYQALVSAWQDPARLVVGGGELEYAMLKTLGRKLPESFMERMMLADQTTYLPDDLLAKVDRASMAVSLEARVPILDHRVVAMSWQMPRRFKVRDGRGKWVLRQVLHRHVPAALVDREKMGFSVPIASWLSGPLQNWARDLLLDQRALPDVLDSKQVRVMWDRFIGGDHRKAAGIWALVLFQAWVGSEVGSGTAPRYAGSAPNVQRGVA